jgi:hypothetical protein
LWRPGWGPPAQCQDRVEGGCAPRRGLLDDPAVTGADTVDARPGFMAALEMIAGNGVRAIIVETANRFARDLIVQETGWKRLHANGIALIAADSPDQFVDETPTSVLIRQILGGAPRGWHGTIEPTACDRGVKLPALQDSSTCRTDKRLPLATPKPRPSRRRKRLRGVGRGG